MPNIAENLSRTARLHPDRPALRFGDVVTTYAELDEAVSRVARVLRADGLVPGDRVALMLPNVPAFVSLYYGVLRAGGVVVPMNPLLKEREIRHCLTDSGAARLFAYEDVARQAAVGAAGTGTSVDAVGAALTPVDDRTGPAEPCPRDDGDLAALLYTSGTTGAPKGAALTHGNLGSNARVLAEDVVDITADDVMMACLPLFHAFGQTGSMNASVRRGACLVLVPRFDPAGVLRMFTDLRVTIFIAVPTMYNALLHHPPVVDGPEADTLRVCVSGGSSLPTEVLYGFEKRFGCSVAEGYGLSETSPVACFNHLDRPRKAGSIGTPIRGVEVRLVDDAGSDVASGQVGEIAIRGANVMTGYWNRPEETAQAIPDGWFRSGDMARRDEDGYYFIIDRKKDMIVRGGYNVYPREIEEVLYEHPDVLEAAVIGVPDKHFGEEVAAVVVLTPVGRATEDELRAYVKDRVAPYKYPREVRIVPSLPKGSTGKILKREIQLPR
ncbi:long-chain fatty acid--CoA ligase [Streptomyces sp. NPDC046716]|uniref:long-chain-fatty-acid--CoA ligase n=1 Tax=Streptomyces sp. NPDC046716 TaxID=3157093 RepID=UPI0033CAE9C2